MNRTAFLLIGLGLLALGVAAWWTASSPQEPEVAVRQPLEPPRRPPQGSAPVAEPDFMDPFPAVGGRGNQRPSGPPPKRIVQVPGAKPAVEDADPALDWSTLTADNLLDRATATMVLALAGNLPAADLLISVRQNCRRLPDGEQNIGRWARRATEFYQESGGESRRGFFAFFDARPTQEENEAELRRWVSACEKLDRILDADMSAELARQAEQGNVAARLLFAMSPPRAIALPGDAVTFDAQFGWESLAREYSWLNLSQGAPEGFLAFGHSYLSGLFTPRNVTLAAAFMKAAMECGQTDLLSGGIVNRFENPEPGGGWWRGAGQTEVDQMQVYYEGIMAYCR